MPKHLRMKKNKITRLCFLEAERAADWQGATAGRADQCRMICRWSEFHDNLLK